MKKVLRWFFRLLACFVAIHSTVVTLDGLIDPKRPQASIAVIFGSKVNKDGTLSPRLKARLDKGLQLFKEGAVDKCYVSGGLGREGHYEGNVMRDYLVESGVPLTAIKVDNKGVNTRATAVNFKRDFRPGTSAVLVTQFFHVSRAKLAFSQLDIHGTQAVHCNFFEIRDIYALLREFPGFYKYLLIY